MRRRTVRKAALAVATGIGLVSLGGCHLEVTQTGPKIVCDSNDYVVEHGPLDVYYRPVNQVVGIFCPGYYPGGQG